jgi:hypothetical protein
MSDAINMNPVGTRSLLGSEVEIICNAGTRLEKYIYINVKLHLWAESLSFSYYITKSLLFSFLFCFFKFPRVAYSTHHTV